MGASVGLMSLSSLTFCFLTAFIRFILKYFAFYILYIILRFIFVRNSLKTEVTAALKRKSNIASLTIAGFGFIIINSLGQIRRAITLEGKVQTLSIF